MHNKIRTVLLFYINLFANLSNMFTKHKFKLENDCDSILDLRQVVYIDYEELLEFG